MGEEKQNKQIESSEIPPAAAAATATTTLALRPSSLEEEEKAPKEESSFEKALVPVSKEKLSPPSPNPTSLLENHQKDEKKLEDIKDDQNKVEDVKEEKINPAAEPKDEKKQPNAYDRDVALANVEVNKKLALIKAWEENEKTKADNKAHKKLSTIGSWENCKKVSVEAELKQTEEKIERKKAEYAEKMKNKLAEFHREAEERRAVVEAQRGEDLLKAEGTAANFRATGRLPKRLFGCFSY